MTPITLGSPAEPSSLPSSPKSTSTRSLKPFDEISNPGEADGEALNFGESTERLDAFGVHDSAPQLVMPSIKMPSRRPFTQRGKNMGRFKILVAGASGRWLLSDAVLSPQMLINYRFWQDFSCKICCPDM